MRALLLLIVFSTVLSATAASAGNGQADGETASAWENMPKHPSHINHSFFFFEPFADGPSVTRACLECHPDSAREVMQTAHWNWQGEEVMVPGHDGAVRIGKRNVINNFCIGVQSNWPACTMCHIGYGWEDEHFDFNDASRVDCLVCHDNSGTYVKKFRAAGVPDDAVDLLTAARSVGMPRRRNCGGCHFQGGGGNAVKHGDMDETLLFPSERIDIHMGRHDMQCVDCHRTEHHQIRGRAMAVSVDDKNRVECTDCHALKPHADVRQNAHTDRLACQACHIPHMAADTGTKMTWDWSEAGQDLDITDEHRYLKIKGRFTWAKKVKPEYYWYNETSTRYITGDTIDPTRPTQITAPLGERDDPTAKIWPFKVHRGKQPYDTEHNYFLVPNVHGDRGFWTAFDWKDALHTGSQVTGLTYSGSFAFAPTEMYFPLSHMVTNTDEALQCRDCHGERGRIDWVALGYEGDPITRARIEHDPVYLNDSNGEPVSESGEPLSVAETCGLCHELEDEDFIATHGYHSSVQDEQLSPERRRLMDNGPRIPANGDSEMNCFLCHLQQPDHAGRQAAIDAGKPEWSVSATLLGTGLLTSTADGYRWNTELVGEDGEVEMDLRPVAEANCGACHGMVHDGAGPLRVPLGTGQQWTTETTGQVFSPQPVRLSGMNHANKGTLEMVWDVHAERLVSCGDCHYSHDRPARLAGQATPTNVLPAEGVKRRCESCHSLENTHTWLPEAARHFNAVACESCHVPKLEMGARRSIDRTVLQLDGSPLISYRGIDDKSLGDLSTAYITGYQPLLRVGKDTLGRNQVLPYNLVSEWFWSDGDSHEPIDAERLRAAWLADDGYPADVMEVFDANHDGELGRQELRLDNNIKVMHIKERLRAAGVRNPLIRGEVRAYHIHHNIRHGSRVNRDCSACHPDSLEDLPGFELAPYVPANVKPVLVQDTTEIILDGSWETLPEGKLLFAPGRGVAKSWQTLEQTIRSEP
ncbi:MAG: tetrathionate reductase family octaheme c-type cytochrome [Gammaproteobacteria bacterium]